MNNRPQTETGEYNVLHKQFAPFLESWVGARPFLNVHPATAGAKRKIFQLIREWSHQNVGFLRHLPKFFRSMADMIAMGNGAVIKTHGMIEENDRNSDVAHSFCGTKYQRRKMNPFTGLRMFFAAIGLAALIFMHFFIFGPSLYNDVIAKYSDVQETRDHRVISFHCSNIWRVSYCGLSAGQVATAPSEIKANEQLNEIYSKNINHVVGVKNYEYLILAALKGTQPALLKSIPGDVITSDIAQDYLFNRILIFIAILSILVLLTIRPIRYIFS